MNDIKKVIKKADPFNMDEVSIVATDSNTANNSASISANIKIVKKHFKENRTQVGWRINGSTMARIQELAYLSRMGINEFVQELLDKALDEIKIE